MKNVKSILTVLLFFFCIFMIYHYLVIIIHNNYPSDAQRKTMIDFRETIVNDETIKTLLKNQSLVLNDVKLGWHDAHLYLRLYFNSKNIDYTPFINRIIELGQEDSFCPLKPMISVLFHFGTPDTASWEPDYKCEIRI